MKGNSVDVGTSIGNFEMFPKVKPNTAANLVLVKGENIKSDKRFILFV